MTRFLCWRFCSAAFFRFSHTTGGCTWSGSMSDKTALLNQRKACCMISSLFFGGQNPALPYKKTLREVLTQNGTTALQVPYYQGFHPYLLKRNERFQAVLRANINKKIGVIAFRRRVLRKGQSNKCPHPGRSIK